MKKLSDSMVEAYNAAAAIEELTIGMINVWPPPLI